MNKLIFISIRWSATLNWRVAGSTHSNRNRRWSTMQECSVTVCLVSEHITKLMSFGVWFMYGDRHAIYFLIMSERYLHRNIWKNLTSLYFYVKTRTHTTHRRAHMGAGGKRETDSQRTIRLYKATLRSRALSLFLCRRALSGSCMYRPVAASI